MMKTFKRVPALLLINVMIVWSAGCQAAVTDKTSASITPSSGGFGIQEGNYKDIEIVLDRGSYSLVEIVLEQDRLAANGEPYTMTLVEGSEYSQDGSTFVVFKEFLQTLPDDTPYKLIFNMDGGDSPVYTLHIIPDESGFELSWMLMSLTPSDAICVEEADNRIVLTSDSSLDELASFYKEALDQMQAVVITPQYEADWWQAGMQGRFVFAVYLTSEAGYTRITITFYLESDQPT
jgi:hypothetical protein